MTDLLQHAQMYRAAGLSVIPTNPDNKRPFWNLLPIKNDAGIGTWEPYQETIADDSTLRHFFGNGSTANVSIVGGKVSGGLCAIDFDVSRFYDDWRVKVGDLANGLVVQRTGRGYHVIFRCPEPGNCEKLAWIPDDSEETGRHVAIEAKAEGGYVQVAPSWHPEAQRRYEVIEGNLTTIPVVSQARADALLAAARKLDECPLTRKDIEAEAKRAQASSKNRQAAGGQVSVIDAYNAAHPIDTTLEHYGYKSRGGGYIRPGGSHVSVYVLDNQQSYHHNANDALRIVD